MEQIYVESNKSYKHGFILKEQDLRRFLDLMSDQFQKLSDEIVEYSFMIKFKNGAVANTNDIETVLKQENEGSTGIVRLEFSGKQRNENKDSIIKLDFRNPDVSEDGTISPIRHSIEGQSRDWVFVTSSLIEERVSKIKRRQLDPTSSSTSKLLFRFLTPVLLLILMISMVASTPNALKDIGDKHDKALNDVEAKWKAHKITDPIDAIIQIEKSKNNVDNKIDANILLVRMFTSKPFIFVVLGIVVLPILMYLYMKFYPVYNFYWGNYIETFNKKESIRKIIIGIIVGTIFLGVIVNLLSNFIWEKL